MAEIRCPNCGQDNPDFFDNCQFCQTPLKLDSTFHAGDAPSEMDTGELEPILPEWLQDARQQNRDSVEDNSVGSVTRPRAQSSEPLDLLAGLSSQDDSDEDEVPDWLASINPVENDKSTRPSMSDEKEDEPSDFFSQFSKTDESQPSTPVAEESVENDVSSFLGGLDADSDQRDELSDWLSQTNVESTEPAAFEQGEPALEDNSWMSNLDSSVSSTPELPSEKESEDLSWLHNLEAEAKKTGDLSTAQADAGLDLTSAQPESSQDGEDLSWLSNLGGAPVSTAETSPSIQESSQEDSNWLDSLGDMPASTAEEPTLVQSESSADDLSWLNNLGGTPASEESATEQPESSQDDLGWLNDLGGTPALITEESDLVQPGSSHDDFNATGNLGEDQGDQVSATPFSAPGTAPLHGSAGYDSTPDWLKSAMEEPLMPAPGDLSMDWFADREKSTVSESTPETQEMSDFQLDESDASTQSQPAFVSKGLNLPSSDSSAMPATSSQDVDDMFNVDMSNWVSREPDNAEVSQSESAASDDDSLAPVDLPSWVQAMRPVDSAIAESTTPDESEQEAESEGPLAGFLGVIPSAPIGSSLRPKAFSLKLQVTNEQQAGASLIEEIIAGETTAQPVNAATVVASQHVLRWILSTLFIFVLSLVVGLGWQSFDIVAPAKVSQLSTLIGGVPDSSPVLLVMDYEPAVAGELAAAAGPVLDQLALARHSEFTFLAMSPNGSAMVEHLLSNTKVSDPVSDGGLEYQSGVQYFNAGFLPGGSAGILGFIDDPVKMIPDVLSLATVENFSSFEAVILLTDNAESGRAWVEQLEMSRQMRPELAPKPLIVISSAQAGPMLEPYVSSGQVDVLINGLSDAAKYEYVNQSRPGTARRYWDAFGIGLMIAILSIVLGSIWNIFIGIRERRAEAEQG